MGNAKPLALKYLLFHFGGWRLKPGSLAHETIPAIFQVKDGPQFLSFQLIILWRRDRNHWNPETEPARQIQASLCHTNVSYLFF